MAKAEDSQNTPTVIANRSSGEATPAQPLGNASKSLENLQSFILTLRWSIMVHFTTEQLGRLDAALNNWEYAVLHRKISLFLEPFFRNWWGTYGLQGLESFFEEEQQQMITYTEKSIARILTMCLAERWQHRWPEGEDGVTENLLERLDTLTNMIEDQWPSDEELGY
ncbi:hypothetical protein F5146DRAFT_1007283 [Armillaria mellea]|nr:hypothetical protein F5146DRAFT_1007283 [Armillaria mellea]